MTEKRYFLHKHLGRDVINDTLCHNWLKGEELEEHMNVQYTKYSALKKENEELESMCDAVREELGLADRDNTVLLKENEQLKQENNKIKNILLNKRKDLECDYNRGAKAGMPTGGIIGELITIEDILEEMEWKND